MVNAKESHSLIYIELTDECCQHYTVYANNKPLYIAIGHKEALAICSLLKQFLLNLYED